MTPISRQGFLSSIAKEEANWEQANKNVSIRYSLLLTEDVIWPAVSSSATVTPPFPSDTLWSKIVNSNKPFSPKLFFFQDIFYYSNRNKTRIVPNKTQENILIVLENTGSLKWTEATLGIKEITNLDLNKIKNFYLLNDNIKRMTKQTAGWQHFFSLSLSEKGFVSGIHFKIYKSIRQDKRQNIF